MKFALIWMMLILPAENPPKPDAQGRDKVAGPRPKEPAKACELVTSLASKSFKPGGAIDLSKEFKNDTASAVTFWECGFWPNHRVTVKDGRGVEPKLTDHGRKTRGQFLKGSDLTIPVLLKPGMSYDYGKWRLDLTTLYTLPPGDYTVEILYHEKFPRDAMMVSSKAIRFSIQ